MYVFFLEMCQSKFKNICDVQRQKISLWNALAKFSVATPSHVNLKNLL